MKISLCSFVKNEESIIKKMIDSISDFVDEINILDTGSQDSTVSIINNIKETNSKIKLYQCTFTTFCEIRQKAARLATSDWVLMLDADEAIRPEYYDRILRLIKTDKYAFGFPRRNWTKLSYELFYNSDISKIGDDYYKDDNYFKGYPDIQCRLFRNDPEIYFVNPVHECLKGAEIVMPINPPIIEHFCLAIKSIERRTKDYELYKSLEDIK